MTFAKEELTQDGFLDGKLSVWQPKNGYRAATDPVFLAASVPASAGQSVLELGCGGGVALLCLAVRVQGLSLSGVEIQPQYAHLARQNSKANHIAIEVVNGDICDLPSELRQASFDHVMCNPPYLEKGGGTKAADAGKEAAFREVTPLENWIGTGIRRLKPKGYFTIIHLAERLPQILTCLQGHLGDIEVKPIASRQDQAARRVIIRGRKDARAPLRLHGPLITHLGPKHVQDGESYTELARRVLREAAPLEF